jgi:crotonobetainyl-CoA:carnitine CoA-transferase CaiB-like acyl-CoA transferase
LGWRTDCDENIRFLEIEMSETFLHDLIVVELGDRLAVGACGSLLAQLGATVVLVENAERVQQPGTKWKFRSLIAAGKKSFQVNSGSDADRSLLNGLVDNADVLLVSTDLQSSWAKDAVPATKMQGPLVCDITAFGRSGPLANQPYSDVLVQAMAGAIDTTGAPDGVPIPTRVPIMELTAATYATAGVLASLRVWQEQGISQTVEVALHDDGISMLSSFLAAHFVGRKPRRIGNHHPSMSPWNLYRTSDGWALICAGSDEQWRRLCEIFNCPELSKDARFTSPTLRVQNHVAIDQIVEGWTKELTTADCVELVNAAAIACGPVNSVADLFSEPSLMQHAVFRELAEPASNTKIRVPGPLFRGSICQGRAPSSIPQAGQDRTFVQTLVEKKRPIRKLASIEPPQAPLTGVRVVEIGNYTTAPLACRQLGALGAYVVKVEAPGGDLGRSLPPVRDGQGYFFTLGNSDKRSLMVDLRTDSGKAMFRILLSKSDILVENLKVGSLARLGFSEKEIARINPRLVHCSTTGFGMDSPYSRRAAMDTTIQGMSGIMDLTRSADGVPYKTGVSIADLAGGQFGLLAALAALAYRDRTGRGQFVDLSMHAVTAWLTQTAWNPSLPYTQPICLIRCSDGYVVAESDPNEAAHAIASSNLSNTDSTVVNAGDKARTEIIALLLRQKIACAPVLSVGESAQHPQTVARNLIITGTTASGVQWPLLACPIRFSKTPASVRRAIGPVGADSAEITADLELHDNALPKRPSILMS